MELGRSQASMIALVEKIKRKKKERERENSVKGRLGWGMWVGEL